MPKRTEITRRRFVRSTATAAAGLAVGALSLGSAPLSGCSFGNSAKADAAKDPVAVNQAAFPSAEVSKLDPDALTISYSTDATVGKPGDYLKQVNQVKLPLGSLVRQISDSQALFLQPGADARTLTRLSYLDLQTGRQSQLLAAATQAAQGFCIYDIAGSGTIAAWIEQDLSDLSWVLLAATLDASVVGSPKLGTPLQLDAADANYDPPTLAVYEGTVFWTVMPALSGNATKLDSYLKAYTLVGTAAAPGVGAAGTITGAAAPQVVYTSHGRMLGGVNLNAGMLTIIPRVDISTTLYQLTALSAQDFQVHKVQVLPSGYKPSGASYNAECFAWTVDATYQSTDNIGKFGSYVQSASVQGQVFYVNKQPCGLPLFWNDLLLVKSSKNVVGYDLGQGTSFVLGRPDKAASYGDCLAATQAFSNLVVYTAIIKSSDTSKNYVSLRVFDRK
jgi:hypothetical protein